jgi:ribonucleotide reductase alpha subunit|tara:strand:- start:1033 stop:1311 length:279 start_codon:yes stop_codon:yes gene_type:complete
MEIKLKNKKKYDVKEFTIADEAKLKDILMKMVKTVEGGVEIIEPNYNCLRILQIALVDSSDESIKKIKDEDRINIALEIQKLLFEGNEKPSK